MKKSIPDIDRMIMESHYLDSLEREDRSVILPEAERNQYLDTIKSLNDTISSLMSDIQRLTKLIEDERVQKAKGEEKMQKLLEKVSELIKENKKLQRELKKYKDRNNRSNRDRFGKSSKKSGTIQETVPSREEESERYDGTQESIQQEPAQPVAETPEPASQPDVSDLPAKRGKRGPYKTMHADYVEYVKGRTDAGAVPEGMRLIGTKIVSEYEKISAIKETRYDVMIVEDAFGNRSEIFVPLDPSETRRPNMETMPHTHAKPSFIAYLATSRHQMSIPTYREMIRVANEKMQMCAQTVWNWLHIGADYLRLLLPSLKKHLLRNLDVLHIDETWTNIRIKTKEYKNGRYVKKYIWVIVNKLTKIVYFLYDNDKQDSRGRRPIQKFLEGYIGGIQTDAYAAYKFFSVLDAKNSRAVCWAHARAKLWDCASIAKDKDALYLIAEIGYLYSVELENRIEKRNEAQIKDRRSQKDVTDTMKRIRHKIRWLLLHRKRTMSDMMLNAVNYINNNWDELQTYLTDGKYDIDNTEAERSIRPWTVSRKNVVAFGSEQGVLDAAVYSTFIETCKKNDISPQDYFTKVFAELRDGNRDYESLLPFNIALN